MHFFKSTYKTIENNKNLIILAILYQYSQKFAVNIILGMCAYFYIEFIYIIQILGGKGVHSFPNSIEYNRKSYNFNNFCNFEPIYTKNC